MSLSEYQYETFIVESPIPEDLLQFIYEIMYEPFSLPYVGPWQDAASQLGSIYVVARDSSRTIVGCTRLVPHQGGDCRQVCTVASSPNLRNKGIGRNLIIAMEDLAKQQGATVIMLNARIPALGFYEKLGYIAQGDEFINQPSGLPHRKMTKLLTDN